MGLWAAAIAVVVLAAIDIVSRITDLRTAQVRLNEVSDETNKRLDEEKINQIIIQKRESYL